MRASFKNPLLLWIFLLITWGVYRYFLHLPMEVDEFIVKPIIWLGAVVYVVRFLEKRSLTTIGWSTSNFFKNVYLGWGIGAFFAFEGMFANAIKYRGLLFVPLGITFFDLIRLLAVSLAVGFTEETLFRGYIFTRLENVFKDQILANIVSSFAFVLIHFPIAIFVYHYGLTRLLSYGIILFVLGLANGFIFSKTRTITAPTISHGLWNLSVMLFK